MGYKLTFPEKEGEVDSDGFASETIEITPSLTDIQVAALKPLRGKGGTCGRDGAKMESASPERITIASCCFFCRAVLIEKIVHALGKRMDYISISVD